MEIRVEAPLMPPPKYVRAGWDRFTANMLTKNVEKWYDMCVGEKLKDKRIKGKFSIRQEVYIPERKERNIWFWAKQHEDLFLKMLKRYKVVISTTNRFYCRNDGWVMINNKGNKIITIISEVEG